ncbi:hypothetical protein [Burkholderia multivorans]|nr:hypothetical protein [Burkholderia multivorans]MDN7844913.1 hypothetical protein [Burkholderia multivorans]MDN7946670.1 hypothetical protein [Burkholderia multivorans]
MTKSAGGWNVSREELKAAAEAAKLENNYDSKSDRENNRRSEMRP